MKVLIEEQINGILNIEQQLVDHKNGLIVHGQDKQEELNSS